PLYGRISKYLHDFIFQISELFPISIIGTRVILVTPIVTAAMLSSCKDKISPKDRMACKTVVLAVYPIRQESWELKPQR
ncbi:MAG: hypothetical protein MUO58_21040, partial [Anaerolineales bacterium]|nr:hypothetical protein [Anaerolineales bacterium]